MKAARPSRDPRSGPQPKVTPQAQPADTTPNAETTPLPSRLRALPSVDALRRAILAELVGLTPAPASAERERRATQAARAVLREARASVRAGRDTPTLAALRAIALEELARANLPMLRPVINATGVIVNTNLGRAPLSEQAIAHVAAVARGYSTLEFDLESGERGSRQTPVRALLRELTGAEDALAVNNNAAAVLLALTALAQGREVIISRGELVEIGGGFRVPDVLRQSGARLVEVGTTNRTRIGDYEAAITPETAALLAVHPSNFRIVGFTEAPSLADLAALAKAHGLPLIHDLGSGAFERTERYGLAHEPMPQESIAAGADLVCFSGDKLLGGPQAGIIAGRAALIGELARHPLARALRIDKLTLAALEVTLRQHRDGLAEHEIPVWRMIATPQAELRLRAEAWARRLREAGVAAEVIPGESMVGGGSLPGETLPTTLCAILQEDAGQDAGRDDGRSCQGLVEGVVDVAVLAQRLRRGDPPIVARVLRKRLLLDPRTVPPQMDDIVIEAALRTLRDGAPGAVRG
jgi:L-seryl-tRNA(Ser) seleniumtransferase